MLVLKDWEAYNNNKQAKHKVIAFCQQTGWANDKISNLKIL